MPLQRCSALLLVAVLSCLVRGGLGLNMPISLHRHVHEASNGSATYAVFAHHKAGTGLNKDLLTNMANTLGLPFRLEVWLDIQAASEGTGSIECAPGTITLYEDMRVPVLQHILQGCPDIRAVHLIRQPSSMLASDIVYKCQIEPGDDLPGDVAFGHVLREMPIPQMVQTDCPNVANLYIQQMVDVHEYIQSNGVENVLEVAYEGFEEAYDNTTRAVFSHFLGSGLPIVDQLATASIQFDVGRMPESVVADTAHVSDDEMQAQVKMEMERQHAAGDPCQQRFWEWDKMMGYTSFNASAR